MFLQVEVVNKQYVLHILFDKGQNMLSLCVLANRQEPFFICPIFIIFLFQSLHFPCFYILLYYRDGDVGGPCDVDLETPPPIEEEPRELTLDEYKALKGNRQKPTYNLRKAGEGEDLTQWKKMYALKKKEGDEEEEEEEASLI